MGKVKDLLINLKRAMRCKKEMGIAVVRLSSNLSKRIFDHKIYPYMLGSVKESIGITYISVEVRIGVRAESPNDIPTELSVENLNKHSILILFR